MKCIYNCNTCSNFYSSFPSWNWKISQWNAYTLAELYIQYTCHYEYIVDPHGRIDYGKLIEIQMFRFSVKVTWSWFAILCFGNTPQTKKRKAWDGSAGCESDALSVNIASPEIMWIERDPGGNLGKCQIFICKISHIGIQDGWCENCAVWEILLISSFPVDFFFFRFPFQSDSYGGRYHGNVQ